MAGNQRKRGGRGSGPSGAGGGRGGNGGSAREASGSEVGRSGTSTPAYPRGQNPQAGPSGSGPGPSTTTAPQSAQPGPPPPEQYAEMPPGMSALSMSSPQQQAGGPSTGGSGGEQLIGRVHPRPPSSGTSSSSGAAATAPSTASFAGPVPPGAVRQRTFPTVSRPGYGTLGRPIKLYANHFLVAMKVMGEMNVYHYDVSISPEVSNRGVCRDVLLEVITTNPTFFQPAKPVYDGAKNVYSARKLSFQDHEFLIILPDKEAQAAPQGGGDEGDGRRRRERRFKVRIKEAAFYPLEALVRFLTGRQEAVPQEIFQALDVALRERPTSLFKPVGRSYFDERFGRQVPLGGGVCSWRGFYQSLRPTQQGLALNVDTSSTAFYEPINLAQFVEQLLGRGRMNERTTLNDAERTMVRKKIKGLRVGVLHRDTQRKYRITGVSRQQTRDITFKEGDEPDAPNTAIVEYYQRKYNWRVELSGLPCVEVGGKGALIPIECCQIIKGQRYNGKLNALQTTAMLRSACRRPNERMADVQEMVRLNDYPSDEYAREFQMSISTQLTEVTGRVLDPPTLFYKKGQNTERIQPQDGKWNMMAGLQMVDGIRIQSWSMVSFVDPRFLPFDMMRRIGDALVQRCTELGMPMNPRPCVTPVQGRLADLERVLKQIKAEAVKGVDPKQHFQLLLVVLPDKTPAYGDIKRICDTELDIPTQCCLEKNIKKLQSQYLANLAMKINVKLGGQNVHLQRRFPPGVAEEPTIILGADVSHPAPGDDSSPSIAAVVASMDLDRGTKLPKHDFYRCLISAQPARTEIIQGLHRPPGDPQGDGLFRQLLVDFYKSGQQKPSRIIYFRDGVSEGEFRPVLMEELNEMRRACVLLQNDYRPKFTVVVVGKRHHTRCFPLSNRDADRSGNCPAGTVVDRTICHPREFDFYMYSHAGLQGTSRPTHYHVLHDDNKFTADTLQVLINSMSYTYARCTRSVSMVPPAYYADLAAERARLYMEGMSLGGSQSEAGGPRGGSGSGSVRGGPGGSGSGSAAAASSRHGPPAVPTLPVVKEIVRKGMFFC